MWLLVLAGLTLAISLTGTSLAQPVLEFAELEQHSGRLTLVFEEPVEVYDLFSGRIHLEDGSNSTALTSDEFVRIRDNSILFDVGGGVLDSLNMSGHLWVVYDTDYLGTDDDAAPPQRAEVRHVIRVGVVAPPGGGEMAAMARLAAEDLSRIMSKQVPPRAVEVYVWDDEDPLISFLQLEDAGVNVAVGTAEILDIRESVGGDMVVVACCTPYRDGDQLALPDSFSVVPGTYDGILAVLSLMDHRNVNRVIPVYVDDTAGRVLADQIRRGAYSVVEEGMVYDPDEAPVQMAAQLSVIVAESLVAHPGSRPGILLTDPSWAPALMDAASVDNTLRLVQWFGVSGHPLDGGPGSQFAADVGYSVPAPGAPGSAQAAVLAARVYDAVGHWPERGTYSAYDAVYLAALSQLRSGDASGRGADPAALREGVRTNAGQLAGVSGYLGMDGQGGPASPLHDMLTVRGDRWVKTAVYNPPASEPAGVRSLGGAPVAWHSYAPGDGMIHDVAALGLLVDGHDAAAALAAIRLGVAADLAVPFVEVVVEDSGTVAEMMGRFDEAGAGLVVAHAGEDAAAAAAAYSDDIAILGTAPAPASLATADNLFLLAPYTADLAEAVSETLVEDSVYAVTAVHRGDRSPLLEAISSAFPGEMATVQYEEDGSPTALAGRIITSARNMAELYGESVTGILIVGGDAAYPLNAVAGTGLADFRWYVAGARMPFDIRDAEWPAAGFAPTGISRATSDGGPAQLASAPLVSLYGHASARDLAAMEAGRMAAWALDVSGSVTGSLYAELIRAALPDAASRPGLVIDDTALDANGALASASYDLWKTRGDSWVRDRLYVPSAGHFDRVVVGMAAPLTGWQSKYGLMQIHAAHLAVSEYNAQLADTAKSWRLAVTVADTAEDPRQAAAALERLHGVGADIVVGPSDGAALSGAAPLAAEHNMTLLSCCSDWPGSHPDTIFRMSPGQDGQLGALAAVMERDAIEALVVLHPDDELGASIAANVSEAFSGTTLRYGYDAGGPPGGDLLSRAAQGAAGLAGGRPGSVGVLVADFENAGAILPDASLYHGLESARWYGVSRDGILPDLPPGSPAEISARSVGFTVAVQTAAVPAPGVAQYVRGATGFEPYFGVFATYDSVTLLALTVHAMEGDTDAPLLAQLMPVVAAEQQGLLGRLALDENGDLEDGLYSVRTMGSGGWQTEYTYGTQTGSLDGGG